MKKRKGKKMVTARMDSDEKDKLIRLARSKGAEGVTGLIRMLVSAKSVQINL